MAFRIRELSVLSEFDLRGGGLAALRSRVDWRGGCLKSLAATAADALGTAARRSGKSIKYAINSSSSARARDTTLSLLEACELGEDDEILQMLEQGTSSIEETDPEGWTALMFACDNGHRETVRLLLERGVPVNQASRLGTTALMIACAAGFAEIVQLLLESGADVGLCARSGWTALMEACSGGYLAVSRLLLEGGADATQASQHGDTALMRACMRGDAPLVRLLCSYGARREATDRHGHTAIDAARAFAQRPDPSDTHHAHSPHVEITTWLERTRAWCTPLHHLEELTAERCVALLRGGADIHARAAVLAPTAPRSERARDAEADAEEEAAERCPPPSPLERAREMASAGQAPPGSPAAIVLDWWGARLLAVAMGTHARLGEESPMLRLASAPELIELILARCTGAGQG